MKSERGVTALTLTIVVVIIAIIAAFSILTSRDVVVEGNLATVYSEISTIREKMIDQSLSDSYETSIIQTFKIEDISEYNGRVGGKLEIGKDYYFFDFAGELGEPGSDTLKQSLYEELDVKSVNKSYIACINDVGDVEVYLVDGIRVDDATLYSYEEIRDVYK